MQDDISFPDLDVFLPRIDLESRYAFKFYENGSSRRGSFMTQADFPHEMVTHTCRLITRAKFSHMPVRPITSFSFVFPVLMIIMPPLLMSKSCVSVTGAGKSVVSQMMPR